MYDFSNKKRQKSMVVICLVVLGAVVITSVLGAFMM